MLRRLVIAFTIAVLVGLPLLLPERWLLRNGDVATLFILSNLPGALCGFLFGGRFFPPEGHVGQSPVHWGLSVMAQTIIWFLILSFFHFVAACFKKGDSNATRSI